MGKFITATFLILGWAFYEMSGGADFVPEERIVADAETAVEEPVVETAAVTRSATAPLVTLALPVAEPAAVPVAAQPETNVVQANVSDVVEAVIESAALTETVPAPAAPAPVAAPALDLRYVSGSRVNMRTGPGTNYSVIDTLPGGTETEVLFVDASGWANIRITGTGVEGWMAERLLTDG